MGSRSGAVVRARVRVLIAHHGGEGAPWAVRRAGGRQRARVGLAGLAQRCLGGEPCGLPPLLSDLGNAGVPFRMLPARRSSAAAAHTARMAAWACCRSTKTRVHRAVVILLAPLCQGRVRPQRQGSGVDDRSCAASVSHHTILWDRAARRHRRRLACRPGGVWRRSSRHLPPTSREVALRPRATCCTCSCRGCTPAA